MDWGGFLQDIGFAFGPGASGVDRACDVIAGGVMVLLGVWLGYERWGRSCPSAEVEREVGSGESAPRLLVAPAAPALVQTSPICLRVPAGRIPGMEGSGPVSIRSSDLVTMPPERLRAVAEVARQELAFRHPAFLSATERATQAAQEVERAEDALREAKANRGSVAPSAIRRMEWVLGEVRERAEERSRSAREALELAEMARVIGEVAEILSGRVAPGGKL